MIGGASRGRGAGERAELPVPAVLDANVLYPAQLRDLLLRLAIAGLVRAHWSDEIHAEWTRAVRERHPDLPPEALARTRALMEQALRGARVTGYQRRLGRIALPDPEDRHVVAAAWKAGARVIVTCNLRDFPPASLEPFGLEAVHPDAFVATLYAAAPREVVEAARRHRASLRRPALSVAAYLATLERTGLTRTAVLLRAHADAL